MTTSSDQTASRHPVPILIFGSICISFAPVLVKLIDPGLLGPTAIGFWRVSIGAVALFALATAQGRRARIDRRSLAWSALTGFIFFLDLFVWHRSIIYAGAGMATILGNTQVFGTAVLSFIIFKERLPLRFYIAAVAAVGGVALLIGVGSEVEMSTRYLKGITYGLLTGLVYANYIVTLKTAGQKAYHPHPIVFMAYSSLFSAVFLAVATLVVEPGQAWPSGVSNWLWLVGLGVIAQALGWVAITTALPRIPASISGLLLLMQPVLATVWGVLFFGEYLEALQILGAVATLVAIYVGATSRRPKNPPAP